MSETFNLMGIDPGINNCGVSIGKYYPKTDNLRVVMRTTIHANAEAHKANKKDSKLYGSTYSLLVLERLFTDILDVWQPRYVACEDAFYNPRTPNAYASLKSCILSFKRVLYYRQKNLYLIAPKQAKAVVYEGTANKEAVQSAIQKLPDLILKGTKEHPLSEMVEHEADSIAIMYTFKKIILPGLR